MVNKIPTIHATILSIPERFIYARSVVWTLFLQNRCLRCFPLAPQTEPFPLGGSRLRPRSETTEEETRLPTGVLRRKLGRQRRDVANSFVTLQNSFCWSIGDGRCATPAPVGRKQEKRCTESLAERRDAYSNLRNLCHRTVPLPFACNPY